MLKPPEKPDSDKWPKAEWHWGEGNKFAIEGIKTLLLLNGGSAIALLTFAGTRELSGPSKDAAIGALSLTVASFGFGALFATAVFVAGYSAQLMYGKSLSSPSSERWAHRWHFAAYGFVTLSAMAFAFGLGLATAAVRRLMY